MRFKTYFSKRYDYQDNIDLYIWEFIENKSFSIVFKDGFLERIPKEEGEIGEKCITIPSVLSQIFMKSLVDGLADAGYVAEVDNAQRITSEALAKEREKELDFFKASYNNLVDKIIEKV